jgi:type 1 fimbria pilin
MRFDTPEGFLRSISLREVLRASIAVALALLLPWLVVAQEPQKNDKATIRGTVTDATQAVVTGATAVLTRVSFGLNQIVHIYRRS